MTDLLPDHKNPISDGHSDSEQKRTDLWRFYAAQEPYVSRNIQLCDAKAAVGIVAFSSAVALLLKDPGYLAALRTIGFAALWAPQSVGAQAWWAASALALNSAAVLLGFWTVLPRTRAARPAVRDNAGPVVSWVDVAARTSSEAYAQEIATSDDEVLLISCLRQLHALSAICARKTRLVGWSLLLGCLAVCLSFLWICLYGSGGQ